MVEMNKILSQTNMIKQQLRTGNIFDKKILDLYQSLPRDEYTPLSYRKFAYSDMQIPIAQQQSMLTPLEEAAILQALQLQGHETILTKLIQGFIISYLNHREFIIFLID